MVMQSFDSATTDYVYQIIHELYGGSGQNRESVDRWLQEFQKSPYSWKISDELLYSKRSVESISFASQTIRTKILKDFNELPAESHQQLKESIIQHVLKMDNTVALKQLCLALADLVLQMPQTNDYLLALLSVLEQKQTVLLTLMTVIPEEYRNKNLRLGDRRRNQVYEEFEKSCPQILHLIQRMMEQYGSDSEVRYKCYRSLEQWIVLGAAPSTMLCRLPLLQPPFTTLSDINASPNEYEAATDLICTALYTFSEDLGRYHEMVEFLKTNVYKISSIYKQAKQMEDIDKCHHLCRLFTELGEALLEMICNTPGEGLGDLTTVNLVLDGLDHYDWEVSYVTFNFWYRLCETLQQNEINTEQFRPLLEKLLASLTTLCQNDMDSQEPPRDDFEDFRNRCGCVVRDISLLLSGPECFTIMFNALQNEAAMGWDRTEAILWILSSIAPQVDRKQDCPAVPEVLNAVFSLPADTHPCLYLTSLKLIGDLQTWISHNKENWLEKSIQYLLSGLNIENNCKKDFQLVSSESLKRLCTSCRRELSKHLDGLLQAVDTILDKLIPNAAFKILTGLSFVISEVPIDVQEKCISTLVGRQATIVETCLVDEKILPHLPLDRIATIFRYLKAPEGKLPHTNTVEEMLPILDKSLDRWQSDYRIVERICKCLRFIIRFLSRNSGPILQIMAERIVAVYSNHRHSCFLYLTSVLVDEIGDNYSLDLQNLFRMLAEPTLDLLNQHDGLRQNPDTVDDWCRLAARMGQKTCDHFYTQEIFPTVFESAIAATRLDHRDASASVYKFLIQCVDSAPDQIYEKVYSKLFYFPLESLIWHVPSYQSDDVAELYFQMLNRNKAIFEQSINEGLEKILTDNRAQYGATKDQMNDFKLDLIKADHENSIQSYIRDFCRLYR